MTMQTTPHATLGLPIVMRLLRRLPVPHKLGLMDRLYGKRLARAGIAWVRTANGPVWKLDLCSGSQRWIVYGDYEGPSFLNWARKHLGEGGVVVDSGANIGQTVLYFGNLPGTHVYAFEPNAPSAKWLRECLGQQRGWRVEVIEQGLSDTAAQMDLLVPDFAGEQGAQATLHTEWYGDTARHVTSIVVNTLDAFVETRKITRIRLWKLDVEGWELSALRGAEATLRRKAVDAAFIELQPDNADAVDNFLTGVGYRLFRIDRSGHLFPAKHSGVGTENLVALPLR